MLLRTTGSAKHRRNFSFPGRPKEIHSPGVTSYLACTTKLRNPSRECDGSTRDQTISVEALCSLDFDPQTL